MFEEDVLSQIEEFKEAFSLFDPDGNNYIQTKELGTVLRSLGIHTTDEEKNEFIELYDKTSNKEYKELILNNIKELKNRLIATNRKSKRLNR